MQATCPQCTQRIMVDDARVPDRPFAVRCPKCQTTVRFPGRLDAAAPPPGPAVSAPPTPPPAPAVSAPPTPPPGPAVSAPPTPSPAPAVSAPPTPRPPAPAEGPRANGAPPSGAAPPLPAGASPRSELGEGERPGRALVALPDHNVAAAVAAMLSRHGFSVDTLGDAAEGVRPIEQGLYAVVATARGPSQGEILYQRISRLGPDARRRIFLLLVGDEFKSGDGVQAFVALADLVLHSHKAGQSDALLRAALDERRRLCQPLLDARQRSEAAFGPS